MNSNIKKGIIQLFLCIIFLVSINSISYAESGNKTIVIVTDQLDFSTIEKMDFNRNISLGLMNTRTSNVFKNSKESYFMTIASGRRVELEEGLFKGIKADSNGNMVIDGYKDIVNSLDENYENFSSEIELLGDVLLNNGVSIAYMGNDVSSLMAADKNGIIHKGYPSVEFNIDWLINKTDNLLIESDVLILSYNIEDNPTRIDTLEEYINNFSSYNIIVFPSEVSGDLNDIRNSTLVPILYIDSNQNSGLLSSDSTKRDGLITNMDIFPELAEIFNIELDTVTGYEIYSNNEEFSYEELIEQNRDNFHRYLNQIIIKYIFHGIVVATQMYIVYDMVRRKNNDFSKYSYFMNRIIIAIYVSILLGIFKLGNSIILYTTLILILTELINSRIKENNLNNIMFFPICANILLLIGVFFNPDMVYNSFFGFNNVVSGGRFYGLNNESMGILLATSVLTFYWIKEKLNSKLASLLILIVYFSINILALSESYASNFGGLLTSLALFAMLLYSTICNNKVTKKNILSLIIIGITIFFVVFAIEFNNSSVGHAEKFFSRVNILGIGEFVDMIVKKVKQLALTAISPPWSIACICQVYIIGKFTKNKNLKTKYPDLTAKLVILFISSIIAFLINDTGAIAFVYINTYIIAILMNFQAKYQ